ncbi:MAG: ABC transporter permease [Hyphomicrobiales bacterium]
MRLLDLDKFQEIFIAIKRNKVRTFFTSFGVFYGIFMLVFMLAAGNGLQSGIKFLVSGWSTNSFYLWSRSTSKSYKGFPKNRYIRLHNSDFADLKNNVPTIDLLAPRMQVSGDGNGPNVARGKESGDYTIYGDHPNFFNIETVRLKKGRLMHLADFDAGKKIAVVGERIVNDLFEKDEDPIGQYIRIKGVFFKVVGVIKPMNNNGEDKSKNIYIPLTTLQRLFDIGDRVGWFAITAKKGILASQVEKEVKAYLKRKYNVHPRDRRAFGSFNVEKEFKKVDGLIRGVNLLAWIVGVGTLLAGVIGISNIMLIIIKERTKEIGVQRALGATPGIIISQIVLESVFLTALAGVIGLFVGASFAFIVEKIIFSMDESLSAYLFLNIDLKSSLWALLILISSGLFAGLIPASRAMSIKPIDALRDE